MTDQAERMPPGGYTTDAVLRDQVVPLPGMTDDQPFTAPQTDFHEAGYHQPCRDPECDCELWDWDDETPVAAGRDITEGDAGE